VADQICCGKRGFDSSWPTKYARIHSANKAL
jgi:hypothetical protein